MSKFYYNGVLLPEIPSEVLSKYPNVVIIQWKSSGDYGLICAPNGYMWYVNTKNNQIVVNNCKLAYYKYDSNTDEWVLSYETNGTGQYPIDSINIIWSINDIMKGSDIYFEATEPVPESGTEPDEPDDSEVKKYLIRNQSVLYTITNDSLTPLESTELSVQLFRTHGFDELPDWSIISSLTNPEILYYQSDVEAELPTISVTMTATPHPQSLIAEPFYLIDSTILGIESVTCEYVGEPLIALSFDNGGFEHYDGTNGWVTTSDSEGMIPTVLTGITTDMWSEKITDVRSIQIRVILNSSSDSLTSIKFNFINQ